MKNLRHVPGTVVLYTNIAWADNKMAKKGDFERLDDFLRVGCCNRVRAWRARVLREERSWMYARFLRTNLSPTPLDKAVGCVVSRGFASDLVGLNLLLISASM